MRTILLVFFLLVVAFYVGVVSSAWVTTAGFADSSCGDAEFITSQLTGCRAPPETYSYSYQCTPTELNYTLCNNSKNCSGDQCRSFLSPFTNCSSGFSINCTTQPYQFSPGWAVQKSYDTQDCSSGSEWQFFGLPTNTCTTVGSADFNWLCTAKVLQMVVCAGNSFCARNCTASLLPLQSCVGGDKWFCP